MDFYESLEEIFGLANNGKGMSAKERMVTMRGCLHGSRRKIYDNIVKSKQDPDTKELLNPEETYKEIKKRLMRFTETVEEKQVRVRNNHKLLTRTKHMSALQFEAAWEEVHAELEEIGLGKTPLEKYLEYVEKMGPALGEEIRKDRRPRPDGAGGTSIRPPKTWEEAHAVHVELENLRIGTRAIAGKGAPQKQSYADDDNHAAGFGDGKNGGKDRKGKGESKGKKGKDGVKGICFEMRDKGNCSKGDACLYDHDRERVREARLAKSGTTAIKPKAKAEPKPPPEQEQEAAPQSGNPIPGLKGKKKVLCKYIKDKSNGKCPDGGNCEFQHNERFFDENHKLLDESKPKGKGKGKKGGKGAGIDVEAEQNDGM